MKINRRVKSILTKIILNGIRPKDKGKIIMFRFGEDSKMERLSKMDWDERLEPTIGAAQLTHKPKGIPRAVPMKPVAQVLKFFH